MVTIEIEFSGKKKTNFIIKYICSIVLDDKQVLVHHLDGKTTYLNCDSYSEALALYGRILETISRNQD